MFNLLKRDIKKGDKIKLYLTTGKEIEGNVVEVGYDYILLIVENKLNRFFGNIIGGWNLIESSQALPINEKTTELKNVSEGKDVLDFKKIDGKVNELIRQSSFNDAIENIEKELVKNIPTKYKSSLLLKKAQLFSSINRPSESEKAYLELIKFNEHNNFGKNNLSHLYTELARLQSLRKEGLQDASDTVAKALVYNPANRFAANLQKRIFQNLRKFEDVTRFSEYENHLIIEEGDEGSAISNLIDIDIKEHKFAEPEILKNIGKLTPTVAKDLLERAKSLNDTDNIERYPLYLEAAKAFSELNVGSYDVRDYQEAAAYYSMLKGNSLFTSFLNRVHTNDIEVTTLMRLKDSASSYYIEALNLLSNINPKSLLRILGNYLKLSLVMYCIEKKIKGDLTQFFKGEFADVFTFCLTNKDPEIEKLAYKAVVDCGASSIVAWNRLSRLPKGTGVWYGDLTEEERSKKIFSLINELEEQQVDITLKPGRFLHTTFLNRRNSTAELQDINAQLLLLEFDPSNFELIKQKWKTISNYSKLFNRTDLEIKMEIERVISIIPPYLYRNQTERTNILLQARTIIEKQIKFINQNTTYFGRTIFYKLLNKWKIEVDELLEEKIAKSYPLIKIIIDPPYFIKSENEIGVPILIKNVGETTTEGLFLNIDIESVDYEGNINIPFSSDVEIQAGNQVETIIVIPPDFLADSDAIELKISAQSIYQGKKLAPQSFQFNIEKEPESYLSYEDIPWKDGPIPPEHLFKGRKGLITDLVHHYTSINRDKPYILYGLTRTGKSSILKYLRSEIKREKFYDKGKFLRFITFEWELQEAANCANAREFYTDILIERTYNLIKERLIKENSWDNLLKVGDRFKDLKIMLDYLKAKNYYPFFFIDEFTYIKDLMDKGIIGPSFLASLREYSLKGLASFIFAGTYDIKKLISDEKYGITGQLVHVIDHQVDKINSQAAEDLICVIDNKLSFTEEAIEHIKFLSGNIPYFIQIICKSCGDYAVENRRRHIGYAELEKVIKILIGEVEISNSMVKRLPSNKFQNNQFSPKDPIEISVLISSLAYFNKNLIIPRGIGIHELEKLWSEKELASYKAKLAVSLQSLLEKKILIQHEEEGGLSVYKFAVDLFRRWWYNHHQDINLELSTLTKD